MNLMRLPPALAGAGLTPCGKTTMARRLPVARCQRSGRGCNRLGRLTRGAIRLLVLTAACAALPACGEVIEDVVTVSAGVIGAEDWGITFFQPNGDGTQLVVNLARSAAPGSAIEMTPINYFIGIPFSWYDSAEDDVFDAAAVESLTPFGAKWGILTPIEVPAGTPFFLASWSGSRFDDELNKPIIEPTDYYTWGKFVVNDTAGALQLSVLASATSLNGIIVGRPVSVPEPSASAVALAAATGLSFGLWRRRSVGKSAASVRP